MEERLNITLQSIDGTPLHLYPRRSNTLREVMEEAQIFPLQKNTLCLIRGNKVHIDLSLASLNVQDGETILVMTPKEKKSKKKVTLCDIFDDRKREIEKMEGGIYEEALRVSDLQFSAFEVYKKAQSVYETMWNQQASQDKDSNEPVLPTITEPATKICEDPLPICWANDEIDGKPLFLPKKKRVWRRKTKNSSE